jgi:hypothetical protein
LLRLKYLTKLTRRLICCLPECVCEIGWTGKAERPRNTHQRSITLHQQGFSRGDGAWR